MLRKRGASTYRRRMAWVSLVTAFAATATCLLLHHPPQTQSSEFPLYVVCSGFGMSADDLSVSVDGNPVAQWAERRYLAGPLLVQGPDVRVYLLTLPIGPHTLHALEPKSGISYNATFEARPGRSGYLLYSDGLVSGVSKGFRWELRADGAAVV